MDYNYLVMQQMSNEVLKNVKWYSRGWKLYHKTKINFLSQRCVMQLGRERHALARTI